MIEELKRNLKDYEDLGEKIEADCRAFCADETKSVAERWEIFKEAPNKIYQSWCKLPPDDLLGFEIEAYDHLGLDRYQIFYVVEELGGKYLSNFIEELGEEKLDLLKNYYMVRYIGAWKNDW